MGPALQGLGKQETDMRYECLNLELIQNREIVTGVYAETSSLGQLLICHGCGDVEAVIVGFLVHEQSEKAWALCGLCVQQMPLYGAIA